MLTALEDDLGGGDEKEREVCQWVGVGLGISHCFIYYELVVGLARCGLLCHYVENVFLGMARNPM